MTQWHHVQMHDCTHGQQITCTPAHGCILQNMLYIKRESYKLVTISCSVSGLSMCLRSNLIMHVISSYCQVLCCTASPHRGCQGSFTQVRPGKQWSCRQRLLMRRPEAWQQLLCRWCRRKPPPHMMCTDISPNQERMTRQAQLTEECLPYNSSSTGFQLLRHPLLSCIPIDELLEAL